MNALWSRKNLAPAIVVGLFIGAAIWYAGASPWWAVVIGLVAAAVVLVWRALPKLEEPLWPRRAPETAIGGRDDVQLLGWAVAGKRGRVQPRAIDRARAVAQARLDRRGLDLDAASDRDRVVALIGEQSYRTLHAANVASMPTQSALLSCLDALDRLAGSAPSTPTPGSTTR
jgi:hypothetical protein